MPAARHPAPVACAGAVLAGGAGRRLGGDKAGVLVGGRTLLDRAVRTVGRVARPVAVVARAETVLPQAEGDGPLVWREPAGPQHPLAGVVHALERSGDRPVLVCAVDMPLLDPGTLRVILVAAALVPEATVVVPQTGTHLQVLCALYRPAALAGLRGFDPDARATDVVMGLGPALVPFEDDMPFLNVNRPQDVERAEGLLSRR